MNDNEAQDLEDTILDVLAQEQEHVSQRRTSSLHERNNLVRC